MKTIADIKNDQYVLITGSSGGIGYELSKVFARNGFNLILVARSEAKLNQFAGELSRAYDIKTRYFVCDLSVMSEIKKLYEEINSYNLSVSILVNNAGFGYWGRFEDAELEKKLNMIDLNITGLTYLTGLFVPDMISNGFGKILNVSSIAAFQPIPFASSYAATKSYVLSFSQALDEELKDKNIRVSALCPPDVESGFQEAAGYPDYKPTGFFASSAEHVVNVAYEQFMKNKKVIRPWKLTAKILAFFDRFFPKQFGIQLSKKILEARISQYQQ